MFVPLSELADVALGYKSLQNDFFYVNRATVEQFGIEERFLKPIYVLSELDSKSFLQSPPLTQWLFYCRATEADLRGTGARRYIDAMGDRAANFRKQTGKRQSIREALAAQSGGLWYSPKAQPHEHHIWLRKGFGGIFSPFLFETGALVDQRCNSISAKDGLGWQEVAAALTSSLFSYSLEINGSISMGAGVLEAPTTKVRDYPVFDVRLLSVADRLELVELAAAVWSKTEPVNWQNPASSAASELYQLDQWLLQRTGSGVEVRELYSDLKAACAERAGLASDKVARSKSKKKSSIGSVASAIAGKIRERLHSRGFPEDFTDARDLDIPINISPELVRTLEFHVFMGQAELVIADANGANLLEVEYDLPIVDAIARAVLLGRSAFSVASNRDVMANATAAFLDWVQRLKNEIERGIQESALGTGYEETLRTAVYQALGINAQSLMATLPNRITLQADR